MSSDPTPDRPFPVLIVEDNPDLRRQLRDLLQGRGITCVTAKNEDEAIEKASCELDAIVADIDLSEAGGDACGGILLAEHLAEQAIRIPIILISYNSQLFLPVKGSPEYQEKVSSLGVRAVLDRNSEAFREELVNSLLQAGQT